MLIAKKSSAIRDRLTGEDCAIYDRMPLKGRLMVHRDKHDALIMQARTLATDRGATPAEIQRNVMALAIDVKRP